MAGKNGAHTNGVALPPTPLKTAVLLFDDVGYPGWQATVQINPRASVYDDLMSLEDGRWWPALGQIVLEWNWPDRRQEHALPLPRDLESEDALDLPMPRGVILSHLFNKFIDEVRAAASLPKVLTSVSGTTSSTSTEVQEEG